MQPLLQWKSNEYYTTCECVFLGFDIQHAMRLHHIVVCSLPRSTKFSTLSHKRHDFRGKKVIEHTVRVSSFCTTFVWNDFHSKKNWASYDKKMCIGLHVKFHLFLSDLTKLEFYRQIFEKCSNMNFHENPFFGSRLVPCGQTDRQTDGQTWRN